ncbi:MAG TPA: hypothetical protein VF625_16320 [Longimicrobium sp.]|jgi:hypothetical protein
MLRRILVLAALLASASRAHAQKTSPSDVTGETLEVTSKVADAAPRVYRAALGTLAELGYPFRALMVDQVILTQPRPTADLARLGATSAAVQVEFAAVGDSTEIRVRGHAIPAREGRCEGEVCTKLLAANLMSSTEAMSRIMDALDKLPPARRTVADSLAAAGAYGYSRANPIRVGGGLDNGAASERAFLATLRGPGGEAVKYLRLGSCCAYPVATAPSGRAMLDAYELTYAGQADPAVVYLSMYELDAPRAPEGFVQRASAATETTRR